MSFSAPIPEYASLAYLFNRWGIEPDEDYLFQLAEMDGLDFYYKHFNDGEFELYSANFNEPPLVKYELDQLQGATPKDLENIGFSELIIERDYQYLKTDVGFAWGRVEITPFFNSGEKVYAFYENQDDETRLDLKCPYANYNEVFLSKDSVIKLESSQSLIKQPSRKIFIQDLLDKWFTYEQLCRKKGTGSAFDLLEDYINRLGLKLYIQNDDLEPYWAFADDILKKQTPFFPMGEYLIKEAYGHYYGGGHFTVSVITVCYSKDDKQEEIIVLGNKVKYSKSIYAYADDIKAFEQEHKITLNYPVVETTGQKPIAPTFEEQQNKARLSIQDIFPNPPNTTTKQWEFVLSACKAYIKRNTAKPNADLFWEHLKAYAEESGKEVKNNTIVGIGNSGSDWTWKLYKQRWKEWTKDI